MQKQIQLLIDLDRCWGCRACEIACKQELSLGVGPRPMQVEKIGPRKINGRLHKDYVPVMCQHCDEPACMDACPTEAIYRAEEGSIQIDADSCIQCGECAQACPFGAIDYTEQHGPVKCTLCFSRRKDAWLPSCAQHCEGRAFTLVDDGQLHTDITSKKHVWSTGRIIYASNKWAGLGKGVPDNLN